MIVYYEFLKQGKSEIKTQGHLDSEPEQTFMDHIFFYPGTTHRRYLVPS